MLWDELALPWQRCLDEAWAAYRAGSVPIGAVIVDGTGAIVATGRNRLFESVAPSPFLAGNRLAHAEMNALVSLDRTRVQPRDCILYTTTEPCPLCTGSIRMERVGEVRYAARDAVAGSIALLNASPFMQDHNTTIRGPEHPDLEAIIVAMHVAFSLHADLAHGEELAAQWERDTNCGVALGRRLCATHELRRMSEAEFATADMVRRLEALLQ